MSSKQAKISISQDEFSLAEETAKKLHFKSPTAFIRQTIREKCAEA